MCDLTEGERDAILGHVRGLEEVLTQIRTSAQSIHDRSWMDHAELDRLLVDLSGRVAATQDWVHHKAEMTHQHG
jgi:hypothetical protein